ncbi:uncharacterized protein PFLUO_LOCUS5978 [Penicillium psychrofluorescens]|uniref:uncharacterized protein n=1 Tax=Penicillium psychrofluorescens TaxID=3158075 RepID=UPI003CCCE2B5
MSTIVEPKNNGINVDDDFDVAEMEKTDSDLLDIRAKDAQEVEHSLTALEAVKAYPMALFWSVTVSMCVIMEGYDTILIGNFFAYPTFAKKYGQYIDSNGNYQLTAAWQSGLNDSGGVGAFFGVLLNGYLVDKFGQKRVIIGALVTMCAMVLVTFFAPNVGVLLAGEVLCGLPWGVFASSAPAYASEVLPLQLRVFMTSYTNMCFIIGQLIAAGVLAGLEGRTDQWSYRIPFALQWLWPAFLIPLMFFAPESPWYLVRKGRFAEAELSLTRLQRKTANINVKDTLATIIHTDNLERELTAGTSYWDCFRGPEAWRTEIACVAFVGQVTSGMGFAYNSTYFFQQVGLTTRQTYLLNTGCTAMALTGTLVSWFAVLPYFGRRQIYLVGMSTLTIILFIIGILNVWTTKEHVAMAQAVLCLIWTFFFQMSIGQLGWALPAEVGSTRLRQKTVCLARNAYYVANVIQGVLQPYLMNPADWNVKGYAGFVWGATAFVTLVWAFFRLPETKGRTFEELDWLFAQKTPTRKFRTTEVNIFDREGRETLQAVAVARK